MPVIGFMPEWRDPTLVENGRHLLLEAHKVSGIEGVQRRLNGIELKAAVEHREIHIRGLYGP
jgi:hypothetical protein